MEDEPMWAAYHVVALTLGSAITIPETANEFAIKGNHLTLIKGNQFDGRTKTDPHKHIHEFLGICDMFKYKDTENEVVRLMMFPLSLTREPILSSALFDRLLGEIRAFSQHENESLIDAWLCMKEMLRNCHGHNMSKGNIIKIFYYGLSKITQKALNAAAGGIFLYKTPNQAYQLLEDKVLLKLDWAKNQKTKSSLKKTVAFPDEGSSNSDTDKIMARIDVMTIKMDAQFKELQSQTKQPTPNLDDDDMSMSRKEKAKFMQTFYAIQADCDVKSTNIILQGLPPEVYALVSNHKVAKELWKRIQLLMQGTTHYKQERECFQNPFYMKKAQQLEPKLYDGNVIKNTFVIVIPDFEETLMLAEESHSKMLLKQQDPMILEKKINTTLVDYANSINSLDPSPSGRPTKVEVPKELPKVSMINTSLKKLKHYLAGFDVVVKKRTTATAISKGSWGFKHTKACFRDEIISFRKALKEIFNTFDQYLIDELTEVQNVFHQMEQAMKHHHLESKMFEVKMNQVLNENERLLEQVINKDIVNIIMNSTVDNASVNVHEAKPCTRASGSQPSGNTKKYKIQRTPGSTQKNKHSKINANSELLCVKCNGCMLSDNHDLCVLNFISNVNARVKSKSIKKGSKRKVWKPIRKVFTNIGYNWRPTGQTFTIVENASPLTRITTTAEVPPRKPTALENYTPKPVVTLVYSRKPRKSKTNVLVSKPKILKSISANNKEPSKSWGSIISDVPSSSLNECRNDHVVNIMGYGDYQIGNVTISRVYYVEGLGHNLFFVGQFCDSNLEVAFRQHTCFICNLEARHGYVRGLPKLKFEKDHLCYACAMGKCKKKPHKPKSKDTNQEKLYLLHMDLCGPMRVASVNGKKYILAIVDDYSQFTWVKCLRTDNGTEFVNQTLREYYEKVRISHETSVACSPKQNGVVKSHFDELTTMASEHISLELALYEMTPATISSGLVPNPPPTTLYVPPSRTNWVILFQPLFDELLNPSPSIDPSAPEVIAPNAEVVTPAPAESISSPSLTTIDQDAPSPSNSQTSPETQSPVISIDFEEENHDLDVAHMNNDPFFSIPIPENDSESSSSDVIPTVVHTAAPNSKHVNK
ncbi:retrovirus-related pol polyprotein from transposon TNT 1-94 [Tanacetum coccineum]